MEMELAKKDTTINEKVNENELARLEIDQLNSKVYDIKKEKEEKDEAFDIATGKINSLEDDNISLKLRMYSATIKKFKTKMNVGTSAKETGDSSDKEKELAKTVKEKNKKLTESETRNRQLAEKLAEIESDKLENVGNVDEKYKKVNDKLTAKSKELKQSEGKLKKSEARVNDILEDLSEKTKKIAELENSNTRLRLMKDQAVEFNEKKKSSPDNDKPSKVEEKVEKKKVKCPYENTGVCRRKADCKEVHPKKTCQPHSKLGSCPLESSCEHRHPYGICYDWERYGSCYGKCFERSWS